MTNVVEMKGIEKSFEKNYVLKKVDFTLEKGSIHALLGENGTGKTTLMNILGNFIPKDGGSIAIDGEQLEDSDKFGQAAKKIAFIHQELSLVNDLSIYENLFLGRELRKGFFLNQKEMIKETKDFLEKLDLKLDPQKLVKDLNPALKQITEIIRALMQNVEVIIMDEPTTSLTDIEIQHVFSIMRTLKNQGVSIIFISHKLNEVLEICDSYTVMRDGCVVASGKVTKEINEATLSRQMVGRELSANDVYQTRPIGDTCLELKAMSKQREFHSVNMHVNKGEIVGVTGLLGDGRSELFAAVVGANYPYEGDIYINGKKTVIKNTTIAKRNNIAYVPKNRKENAIVKDLNIQENIVLPALKELSKMQLLSEDKMTKAVDTFVDKLDIKLVNQHDSIGSLSGGNQQKVVLAKALCTRPDVVVLDNPTQGVDVGAKIEIYNQILSLADEGISFIILSSEIPEIKKLCDRVYVMFHGEVKYEFTHEEINEEDIMLVATGGSL